MLVKPIASKVDDIGKGLTQAPKPAWQMEELPGITFKIYNGRRSCF